ncbi:protein lingerer isoform X2 [Condylostylus longicornis]|uniref:protein lingerer isoform X2 n=1 Tax=Condylostylus longicornis TaxID=2530218 RepID=UPI00244E21E7|nr:protein lingerer isoform X2 [Condylostylus longicornis]
MSTQARSSGGGGRNQKKTNSVSNSTGSGGDSTSVNNKKTDSNKPEKEKPQQKPTAEQMRIAQITDISSGNEDPKMREKVTTLIEMTQRSEEDVCCALYECDNNLERAVVFLLETLPVNAFETSSKKKKNRVATTGNEAGGDGDWSVDSNANTDKKEKTRNRSSNRGGRGGSDSRGWRGREARENDRNAAGNDTSRDINRNESSGGWRGRGRGTGRGSFGGRGGRGGRMGPRGMGSRDDRGSGRGYSRRDQEPPQEVDTWDNTIAQNAEKQQQMQQQDDAWGDWDNEEYVGSLKDSKVFTTSNLQNTTSSIVAGNIGTSITGGGIASELSAPPGLEQHLNNSAQSSNYATDDLVQQYSTTVVSSTATAGSVAAATGNLVGNVVNPVQFPDIHSANPTSNQHLRGLTGLDAAAAAAAQQLKSATLSAEQSQYFNSLSAQNAQSQQQQQVQQQQSVVNSYTNSGNVQYANTYGNVFSDQSVVAASQQQQQQAQQNQQQTSVRRTRAKVPPPSKIPSSAVEMPGDTLNNIGYLDVQFGGLAFGAEDSFDTITDKFNAATTLDSQQNVNQDVANDYQSVKQSAQQSALSAAGLQSSQINDNLTSTYSQRASANVQQNSNVASMSSTATNALDQLTKNDPYVTSTNTTGNHLLHPSSYNSNQSTNKGTTAYQSSGANQGYSSSSYANTQVSSGNSYQPSANSYNSYNQNSVNSYQQQSTGTGNNTSSSVVSGAVNSGNSSQNIPVGGNSNSVNNSSQYQSNQTTSAFPTQQSAYQNSQSVYGGTGGLSNSSGYNTGNSNTSSTQYGNFSSSKLKETSTSSSSHYDSVSNVTSSSVSSTVSSVSSSVVTSNANNSMNSTALSALANASNNASNKVQTNSSSSTGVSGGNSVTGSGVSSGTGVTGVSGNNSTSSSANKNSSNASGMVPNIQMVSQYIQTGMPYYQQPAVYSYEEVQMMQQRMPHVAQYYDINYPPTSLSAAGVRDASLGSVTYSAMTDGRFTRTDNNSSPVSNVSSTMSQPSGPSGQMLNVNVPFYYHYGGNVMPTGFQAYGNMTPAIYPQQIPTANATSGGQFPKPSYNSGYGSANYDALTQAASQDAYTKGAYPGSGVSQQTKSQNVSNPAPTGSGTDITSSIYGKSHVALNKVNSYEKQNFHSATPPPFSLTGTQTAGATSAQPYGMYIQPLAPHNMNMHQPIHQMDGRIHNSSRRDSNSTGQRQQTSTQSKSATKQGYSPSYWTAQN